MGRARWLPAAEGASTARPQPAPSVRCAVGAPSAAREVFAPEHARMLLARSEDANGFDDQSQNCNTALRVNCNSVPVSRSCPHE